MKQCYDDQQLGHIELLWLAHVSVHTIDCIYKWLTWWCAAVQVINPSPSMLSDGEKNYSPPSTPPFIFTKDSVCYFRYCSNVCSSVYFSDQFAFN